MNTKSTFNVEDFRLPFDVIPSPSIQKNISRQPSWFIKGPIPGPWILKALTLKGEFTPFVALAIWYVRGMSPENSDLVLKRYHFNKFDVKKDSARRALMRLQKAGLITYDKTGHKFLVTILDTKSSE